MDPELEEIARVERLKEQQLRKGVDRSTKEKEKSTTSRGARGGDEQLGGPDDDAETSFEAKMLNQIREVRAKGHVRDWVIWTETSRHYIVVCVLDVAYGIRNAR